MEESKATSSKINRKFYSKEKALRRSDKKLESLGFNIIYVDEASVWPQNITLYSWCHKYKPDPIIRPSTRLNMIAAMILPHKYAFMLKNGSSKSEHIIFFFELLDSKLCDWFGEEYIRSTIIVFDNASIHMSDRTRSYLKYKKLSVLTLPPTHLSKILLNKSLSDWRQTYRAVILLRRGLNILLQKLLWQWNKFILFKIRYQYC